MNCLLIVNDVSDIPLFAVVNSVLIADFESLYNAIFFSEFVRAPTCLVSNAIVDVPSASETKFAFSFVPPESVPSASSDPTTLPVRTKSAVKS